MLHRVTGRTTQAVGQQHTSPLSVCVLDWMLLSRRLAIYRPTHTN